MDLCAVDDSTEDSELNWQTRANSRCQALGSVTTLYLEALVKIQAGELERLSGRLPNLEERSWREICQFADRLVGTMLNPPLASLHDESDIGSPQELLDALQKLFQLSN